MEGGGNERFVEERASNGLGGDERQDTISVLRYQIILPVKIPKIKTH